MGFMGIVSACRYGACFFWKTDPLFWGKRMDHDRIFWNVTGDCKENCNEIVRCG